MDGLVQTRMFCYPGLSWQLLLAGKPKRTTDWLAPHGPALFLRGRTALWNGLRLLGLQPGDGFLFPAYHCGSELEVLLAAGLDVTFYGVDQHCKIDVDELSRLASPRTRGLYVIHYFGFPQPIEELVGLCKRNNWRLVEDCAQALFARSNDVPVGTTGDIGIFSLHKFLPIPCCGALSMNGHGHQSGLLEATSPPSSFVLRQTIELLGRGLATSPLMNSPSALKLRKVFSRFVHRSTLRGHEKRSVDALQNPRAFIMDWRNSAPPKLSLRLLRRMSASDVVRRRRENFEALLQASKECRLLRPLFETLELGACPLYFPVIIPADANRFIAFCHARGVMAHALWRGTHVMFPQERFAETSWLRGQVVVLPVHQGLQEEDRQHLYKLIVDWEQGHP